jgi:hypothetical protein
MELWILTHELQDYDSYLIIDGIYESVDDAKAAYPDVEWSHELKDWQGNPFERYEAPTGLMASDYSLQIRAYDFHPAKVKA